MLYAYDLYIRTAHSNRPNGVFPSPLCFYKLNNFVLSLWYHEAAEEIHISFFSPFRIKSFDHLFIKDFNNKAWNSP